MFPLAILPAFSGFSQDTTRYYILFSARFASFRPFSIGGHAFSTWRIENINQGSETQLTYGFFPINGNGLFESTESMLEQGYIKNSNKERLVRRLIIETDSIAYFISINQIKNWKFKLYNLFNNNCVHFIDDIARTLNLTRPTTNWWLFPRRPSIYLRKLKRLNKSRISRNEALEKVRLNMLKKAKVEVENDDEVD